MSAPYSVLVTGAHGVIGRAVAEHLHAQPDWNVTTLARRGRLEHLADPPAHRAVDLLDHGATSAALSDAAHVTHVVHAAYVERPTMAEAFAPNVAMLAATLDALSEAGAQLERVVLIGGGKSYGAHLGPYLTPAKEHHPRLLGPIFYYDQEDLLAERARRLGFEWSLLRPDAVIGLSTGSPMNLLTAIGVYGALSRQAAVPLRFPGSPAAWSALHQLTDADLLARAVAWALTASDAAGEAFNVTNGDNVRWQHLWGEIAEFFELEAASPQPMRLAEQMEDKQPAWERLVAEHGLRPTPWRQLVSWPFAEAIWNMGYDAVQSTIKIRKAGFGDCEDSHESLLGKLARLRAERWIP